MAWQYHPLLVVFSLGGVIAVGIAAFCLRYVRRHGASYLVVGVGLLGVADAVWLFAATFKTASPDLTGKLLFYRLEFLGSWTAPVLVLVVALAFVGWDRWLTRRALVALAAFPAAGVPLVALGHPGPMIADPVLVRAGGIVALEHSFPPLFVLFLSLAAGLVLLSAGLVGYAGARGLIPARPAAVGTLVFLLPAVAVLLKTSGVYPPGGRGVNVTPAANAVSLAVLSVAIVRYRLFDALPVGRHRAVEVMDDGYVLVGTDGGILDANTAANVLLADSPDATLVGEAVDDHVPGPVAEAASAPDGPDRPQFDADGRTIEVRSSSVSRQQQAAGHLLLLQDVTERERRTRELERTNERLDRFAGVVSHDLRNPLTVAQGRVDLARVESDPDEHLETAATALDRMEALIDDVLAMARADRSSIQPRRIRLSSVVDRCWAVVDHRTATLTVEDDLAFVADPDRLQQLLENLFRNAIEHGGDDVTVRVGGLPEGSGFYVADDGPGVPPSDRGDVFELGYSTAPDGTGFGLGIAARIADAHGWTVTVTDARSGGARIEVAGVTGPGDGDE
jgi:signal transduction histidine kinase